MKSEHYIHVYLMYLVFCVCFKNVIFKGTRNLSILLHQREDFKEANNNLLLEQIVGRSVLEDGGPGNTQMTDCESFDSNNYFSR